MDFIKILGRLDQLNSTQQINESSKEDMQYYFGKDKKDADGSKEKETSTGHMAKKTEKGTQYTKKDLPGQDTSKDADTKEADRRAKKKANEDISDMLNALDNISENKKVEEEEVDENAFNQAAAAAARANQKEFEFPKGSGKMHPVKMGKDTAHELNEQDKTVKEAVDLEECYGQAMMGDSPEQESGMNINASTDTRTGSKSLTVTAQGEAAEQLAQLLKLSGIGSGNSGHDVEMGEDYANEPEPEVQGIEVQLAQGTDLNRPKGTYPKVAGADNPMNMREAKELAKIEQQLTEALSEFKVSQGVAEAKKGSKPMKKALADKSKKKVSETVVAEKAKSQQQQKFMGMVHAMQKGEKVKGASPELKKVAKSMGKKDVEDFAKTKHKGLPKKVSESEFKKQLRSLMEADGHQVSDAVLEAGWQDFKKNIGNKLGAAAMAGTIGLGAMGGAAQAKGNPYDSPEQQATKMQQRQNISARLSQQVAVHGKETKNLGNDFYAVNINTKNGKIPAVYDAHAHTWIIKNPGTYTVNNQKPAFINLTYLEDSGMFKQDAIDNMGPETTKALQQAGLLESIGESEFKKQLRSLLEADGHQVTDAVLEAGWQDFKKKLGTAAMAGAIGLGALGGAAQAAPDTPLPTVAQAQQQKMAANASLPVVKVKTVGHTVQGQNLYVDVDGFPGAENMQVAVNFKEYDLDKRFEKDSNFTKVMLDINGTKAVAYVPSSGNKNKSIAFGSHDARKFGFQRAVSAPDLNQK